ncbi:Outer mitochondrial membrane protein porin [Venustampulla echinocandica]|uniref:Outer mitochondrial membrane protein porin n=1 Tax=Venustampulla echinocandica TaxID=2656787 RepID=A0A370TQL9_9HELO|nr:Outer mitochondrial membrane protein porin [Venustampulla echinocandica]RDL37817.1 Outer mitochondrial membrane protein porin [Venustampulla echinocandica]
MGDPENLEPITAARSIAPSRPEFNRSSSTALHNFRFHQDQHLLSVEYSYRPNNLYTTNSPNPPLASLTMSVPAFADIAKSSNDLLNKDFYHLSAAALEVKSNTPNNVAFKVTGKSTHEGATSGLLEAKYTDKATGISLKKLQLTIIPRFERSNLLNFMLNLSPLTGHAQLLIFYRRTGLTLTESWNTANALETKIELKDAIAKGLKAELLGSFLPEKNTKGAKFNLHFQQANFHGRAFFDLLKGPTANVDAVIGQDGFLAGAAAGYDVQKAAITNYSAAIGYTNPAYTASITAVNNLSVFSAAYYHKVNSQVEAGAKATWDSKSGNQVGLEVASKYRLDPVSFAKVKINDRGVTAVAYNVLLRPGVTLGLGASIDTQKLDQATHKIGASFTFDS